MRIGLLCLFGVIGLTGCGNIALSVSNIVPTFAQRITEVAPAASATDVPVDVAVTASFTRIMDLKTFEASTFTLKGPDSAPVAGTVSYGEGGTTSTFRPNARLVYNTLYTALVTTGMASSSGAMLPVSYSWSFTTETGPAPRMISSSPAYGSTGVSIRTALTATFSEPMQASSVTASTFTVMGPDQIPIAGAVSYSFADAMATFRPEKALAANTAYVANLTTGAIGADGTPLEASAGWTFITGSPTDVAVVDFATAYQTIRGFGGSNAWLGQLTLQQATALFNPTSGLGLSILRVRVDPSGSVADHWVPSNGGWATELANATEAVAANPNALVFASPWTPPPSMKNNSPGQSFYNGVGVCEPGAGFCGGYLDPAYYAAYAVYLEDFVLYFEDRGVRLYGISLQNEPDFSNEPGETYESCSWTPQQINKWIDSNASVLTTRLIMPESANFNPAEAAPSLSDSTAASLAPIVAGHLYGAAPSYDLKAEGAGKEVWMTEHYLIPSGPQPTMADALRLATEVHQSMVIGQYNAYVWWSIWSDTLGRINYGLIDDDLYRPAPTYFGFALGQFSRFVQPGYARNMATANPSKDILVSAYSGIQFGTKHSVIVVINSGPNATKQLFSIAKNEVSSFTPYVTTSAGGLAQGLAVNVVDGNFTYILPAQSITTFVQ